jgi:pSer/pThr/pTyr-binding forkhead associated (FHA) protein
LPAWVPVLVLVAVALVAVAAAFAAKSGRRRKAGLRGGAQIAGAHLEFIYGPLEGQAVSLSDGITTLGSAAGNSVVIPDPAVSRKHLGIRRDPLGGGYELADLGSTNGVYVNGHRLAKRVLAPGDIIRIGASEMVFHLEKTR